MKYITILIVALFISCGTKNKVNEITKNTVHKKWELSVLNGKQVAGNQPIYIELTEDGKVSGFIGCNRLNGSYTIENETQIKFSQLGTTRMACPEMEMELEKEVLELLNTTDNFTLDDGKLMLNIGRRAPLAVFYEMNDNEIVNKYWKLSKLDNKDISMAENQEREQYFILRSDGSLSGFAGCNQFNGEYKLTEENEIKFNDNMAVTLRACPDVKVDENAFLKIFSLADNYTINGDTLHLNSGDKTQIATFEAIYF